MTLSFYTTVTPFQSVLLLMLVYQQTEFGCKKIISSEDIVETVIL